MTIGRSLCRGDRRLIGIDEDARRRHAYIVGAIGRAKIHAAAHSHPSGHAGQPRALRHRRSWRPSGRRSPACPQAPHARRQRGEEMQKPLCAASAGACPPASQAPPRRSGAAEPRPGTPPPARPARGDGAPAARRAPARRGGGPPSPVVRPSWLGGRAGAARLRACPCRLRRFLSLLRGGFHGRGLGGGFGGRGRLGR